jgi:hypothetical protein
MSRLVQRGQFFAGLLDPVAVVVGEVEAVHAAPPLRMLPVTPASVTRTVIVRPGVRRMTPAATRRRSGYGLTVFHCGTQ